MKAFLLELFGADKQLSWRRVAALAVATVLLCSRLLDQWAWVVVCGLFLGGEAAERVVQRLGGGTVAAVLAPPPAAPSEEPGATGPA